MKALLKRFFDADSDNFQMRDRSESTILEMQGKTSSDCKYLFQPNCAKFLHLSVSTKSFVYLSTAKPRPKQWKPKHFDDLLAGISLEIGCDFFLLMMTHKLSVVSIKQPTLRLWMSMRHLKHCSLYTLFVGSDLVNYPSPHCNRGENS